MTIGKQQIDIVQQSMLGRVGERLSQPLKVLMVNENGVKYPGEYYATASLINENGQEQNASLIGTQTVDGVASENGESIHFSWPDLTVSDKGLYKFEITVWEKPSATPHPTNFGSTISPYTVSFR